MRLERLKDTSFCAVIVGSYELCFSYETLVALFDAHKNTFYVTAKKWSPTTSKHIHKWCLNRFAGFSVKEVPQELLDSIGGVLYAPIGTYIAHMENSLVKPQDLPDELVVEDPINPPAPPSY